MDRPVSGSKGSTSEGTTAVSGGRGLSRHLPAALTLARASLLSATVLSSTACLDGTPDYVVPTRVPPIVDMSEVLPLTTRLTLIPASQDFVQFAVPFRSEDGGERVRWSLLRDYDPAEREQFVNILDFGQLEPDPRPFAEQDDRRLSIDWSFDWDFAQRQQVGCTHVTLILTPRSNVESLFKPIDPSRAAQMTWWFNFGDSSVSCPGETVGAQ